MQHHTSSWFFPSFLPYHGESNSCAKVHLYYLPHVSAETSWIPHVKIQNILQLALLISAQAVFGYQNYRRLKMVFFLCSISNKTLASGRLMAGHCYSSWVRMKWALPLGLGKNEELGPCLHSSCRALCTTSYRWLLLAPQKQKIFLPEATSTPPLHSWTFSRDAQGSREYDRGGKKYGVVSRQLSWPLAMSAQPHRNTRITSSAGEKLLLEGVWPQSNKE